MRSGMRTTSDGTALAGLVALAFAAVIMGGLFLGYRDVDVWGAFVVPLLLFGVTAPALLAGERRRESGLGSLFILGLALTFVASYVYYLITFHYYPGGDAGGITGGLVDRRGLLGRSAGSLATSCPLGAGPNSSSKLPGWSRSWSAARCWQRRWSSPGSSSWGVLLFINAARRGVPDLLDRRYVLLMLFLPSVLYWPSALGKDAWMLFMLGLASYGASLVFDRRLHGWAIARSGHLRLPPRSAAPCADSGRCACSRIRDVDSAGTSLEPRPRSQSLGAGVLVVGLSFALSATSDLLPTFSPSDPLGTAGDALDSVQSRTAIGGSEIDSAQANSLLTYPYAVITVLLRPLPFEARSLTTLLASMESMLLIALFWKWRRNVVAAFGSLRSSAYMRFALLYAALFTFAWSSVSNLGIIARQRVQVLPFLLVLLVVAAKQNSGSPEAEVAAAESQPAQDIR
jgi:hypothetical protein